MLHQPLEIPDLVLFTPEVFADERGSFAETFRTDLFDEIVGQTGFVQDNQSTSRRAGTLRGLHFQISPSEQGKLVRAVRGAVFDVAVDIRAGSPTFGRHAAAVLSADNWHQLWVPPGFAHGFVTLLPDTVVTYRTTAHYDPRAERGLAWDDPGLAIDWPMDAGEFVMSEKDRHQPRLGDLPDFFVYPRPAEAAE